jgi:demethylmenaquinone methyltransferase/2-methoxy-6-polyprenyl-1,4-benzoquinol methylase
MDRNIPLKPEDPRIAFFDHHAAHWDSYGPPLEHNLHRLRMLLPMLGLQPGQEVLEVGCGTGLFTGWLESVVHPGHVTAADFSPAMIEAAEKRGLNATFRIADACRDALGTACFDVAFCLHVVPHFRDLPAALANLARALKPNGLLVVLHLMGRSHINNVHHHAGGAVAEDRLPDAARWGTLLQAAGMGVCDVIDHEDLFLLKASLIATPQGADFHRFQ